MSGSFRCARFLPTPSARRATWRGEPYRNQQRISTHALREEGDAGLECRALFGVHDFYPRPPRGGRRWRGRRARSPGADFYPRPPRGGRPGRPWRAPAARYFYPRPPRGGRLAGHAGTERAAVISTHALREEGDATENVYRKEDEPFLPTPSARRATHRTDHCLRRRAISTHALREEGDAFSAG